MPRINVKWGAKKLEVDVNQKFEPMVFKCQLFELTGVMPERQKVLIKGRMLKDEGWGDIALKEGTTIIMMGSSEALPKQIEKVVEEVKAEESKEEKVVLPIGLKNLGNTCYLNASLQCYKVIPELAEALNSYNVDPNMNDQRKLLTSSMKKFYETLANLERAGSTQCFIPFLMIPVIHNVFPQFAGRDDHGQFQQQDASECFAEILRIISEETKFNPGVITSSGTIQDQNSPSAVRATRLFETEFEATLKCMESQEEPAELQKDKILQMSCFLSQEVKYIQLGIKSKLTEEIEKMSPTLNRNAKYQKKSLISRLPAYLSIQMVRFFYKEKDQINAKILKDVKFPINLDLQDVCTPELKAKLQPMRDMFKAYNDRKVEEMRQAKIDMDGTLTKAVGKITNFEPYSFAEDPGSNNSGLYELKALITHKGRSSNSGHYVAWVRVGTDKWAMCDDDEVHPVNEEDVLKLSGGGDWHCAYVLIYGPRPLPSTN